MRSHRLLGVAALTALFAGFVGHWEATRGDADARSSARGRALPRDPTAAPLTLAAAAFDGLIKDALGELALKTINAAGDADATRKNLEPTNSPIDVRSMLAALPDAPLQEPKDVLGGRRADRDHGDDPFGVAFPGDDKGAVDAAAASLVEPAAEMGYVGAGRLKVRQDESSAAPAVDAAESPLTERAPIETSPRAPGPMPTCVDMPTRDPAWTGAIPSTGEAQEAPVIPGAVYILVVRGTFQYSSHGGLQDARFRWHNAYELNEPACVGCARDAALSVAFVVDGSSPTWLQECSPDHTHVFVVRATKDRLTLRQHDAGGGLKGPYSDNAGELRAALYPVDASEPLLARDREGYRLNVAVGPARPPAAVGLKAEKADDIYYFKQSEEDESFYQRDAYFQVDGRERSWIVEVDGKGVVDAGVEVDVLSKIEHKTTFVSPIPSPLAFNCRDVNLIKYEANSHRALVSLGGCGPVIRAHLQSSLSRFYGQLRLTLYEAP